MFVRIKKEQIKQHIIDHQTIYACIATGVVVGIAARRVNIAPIFNNNNQPIFNNIIIAALGDPGDVIQDIDTLETWASRNQAAKLLGVSPNRIREHLDGKLPDVKGRHLRVAGKAGHTIQVAS